MSVPRWWGNVGRMRAAGLTVVLVAALLGPVVGAAPDAQASSCTLDPQSETYRIGHPLFGRPYHVRVPDGLTEPAMLLLSLHPGAYSATAWEDPLSGWTDFAEDNGFVVVYPQGFLNLWDSNAPSSVDYPYLLDVVDAVTEMVCIDPDRIHVTGYSMGGWMAQRLACEDADVFASVAGGGAGHPEDDHWIPYQSPPWLCEPDRPIAVHLSMGTEDDTATGLNARDEWRDDNSCGSTASYSSVPAGTEETWSCADGTEVVWRTLDGYDHFEGANPVPSFILEEQYEFFVDHPRP